MKVMLEEDELIAIDRYLDELRERYKSGFELKNDSSLLVNEEQEIVRFSKLYKQDSGNTFPVNEFWHTEVREHAYMFAERYKRLIAEELRKIRTAVRFELFENTILQVMTGQQLQDILLDTLRKAKDEGLI